MKKKHEIWATLGPSSLNKDFLKFCKNKVSLLRLNMSHINLKRLPKIISFVKKNSNIPICIDTEGAQIRTKVKKNKFYKNMVFSLSKTYVLQKYLSISNLKDF